MRTVTDRFVIHASCIAVDGRGLIIRGASGAGKSSLALQLLALGADLVSDDRTHVVPAVEGPPMLSAPQAIRGVIEARALGLLSVPYVTARAVAILDLSKPESERLPPARYEEFAGCALPVLHKVDGPHFAAAVLLYLKGGKAEP